MQLSTTYQNRVTQNSQSVLFSASQEQFSIEKSVPEVVQDSSTQSDEDVAQFLSNLRTKGAAKFLADLNKEKIEKMVEEYKQKLLEKFGDSPEAMKEIAKMVADYKKKLLEELQNSLDNDDKKDIPIDADALIQSLLLDGMQNREKSPFQKLLFET